MSTGCLNSAGSPHTRTFGSKQLRRPRRHTTTEGLGPEMPPVCRECNQIPDGDETNLLCFHCSEIICPNCANSHHPLHWLLPRERWSSVLKLQAWRHEKTEDQIESLQAGIGHCSKELLRIANASETLREHYAEVRKAQQSLMGALGTQKWPQNFSSHPGFSQLRSFHLEETGEHEESLAHCIGRLQLLQDNLRELAQEVEATVANQMQPQPANNQGAFASGPLIPGLAAPPGAGPRSPTWQKSAAPPVCFPDVSQSSNNSGSPKSPRDNTKAFFSPKLKRILSFTKRRRACSEGPMLI